MSNTFNDYYKVEKILAEKNDQNKKTYLIKWEGYSNKFNTWEPE